MLLLSRSDEGGFIIKRPGAYSYEAESYCLHAGAYAPEESRGGNGYLYASLKGPQSHIFRNILQRSTEHPEIKQFQIQGLIWSVLSRTKITKLSPLYYPAANALLTPKEMLEVSGGAIGLIPDRVIDHLFSELPPFARKIYETEAKLRRLFTSSQTTFEEIERIAVLTGDPPNLDGDRRVPSGRWSYHPNGFWIRFYPSGYSSTQIELTVPLAYEIERDNFGRIIKLSNERADTLVFSYDDNISVAKIENDLNIKGYAFQSVKYVKHEFMAPEAIIKKSHAWANQGYTLVGIPSGNGIATISNDRYIDIQDTYNQSVVYKNELEILSQQVSLDNVFGDLMDIIHLSISLEKFFKSSEDKDITWLATNMQQFLKEGWQHIFNNYNGQYDNREGRTYDPSESIAQPGEQGRQRLALSGRPKDKDEDKKEICKILQDKLLQQESLYYAYDELMNYVISRGLNIDDWDYKVAAERLGLEVYKAGGPDSYVTAPWKVLPLLENIPPRPTSADDPTEFPAAMWTDNDGVWGYSESGKENMVKSDGTVSLESKTRVHENYINEYGKSIGEILFDAHYAHEMTHLQHLIDYPERFFSDKPEDIMWSEMEAYKAGINIKESALANMNCN